MYIMFSTPLTCCSIGAATVSETTWALAPGYWQVTITVGGAIWGYMAMGRAQSAIPPASVIAIDRTVAKIGRSMKKRENTALAREGFLGATGAGFERSGRSQEIRARRGGTGKWPMSRRGRAESIQSSARRRWAGLNGVGLGGAIDRGIRRRAGPPDWVGVTPSERDGSGAGPP